MFKIKEVQNKNVEDKSIFSAKADALGTIEIVIIIAVLIAVALIFKEEITDFAEELMDKAFDSSIIDQL